MNSLIRNTWPEVVVVAALIGLGTLMYFHPSNAEQAEEDVMNGYYDPVNKIMCYWVKGSKATPACLYADWPVPPQEESAQEPMRYVY